MSDYREYYIAMTKGKSQLFEYNKNEIKEYYDGKTYFDLDEAYASLYKNALLERYYLRKLY